MYRASSLFGELPLCPALLQNRSFTLLFRKPFSQTQSCLFHLSLPPRWHQGRGKAVEGRSSSNIFTSDATSTPAIGRHYKNPSQASEPTRATRFMHYLQPDFFPSDDVSRPKFAKSMGTVCSCCLRKTKPQYQISYCDLELSSSP